MERVTKFVKLLLSNKLMILLTIILSFLTGYLVSSTINYFCVTYECEFTTAVSFDENELLSKEHLEEVKESAEKYSDIDVDRLLKDNAIYFVTNDDSYSVVTYSHYYEQFFLTKDLSVSTRAKMYLKDTITSYIGSDNVTFALPNDIIVSHHQINNYLIATITSASITLIELIVLAISDYSYKAQDFAYQEGKIFSKQYWINASKFVSSPRKITNLAMLFALLLVSKLIVIPSGFASLGLSFGYIFLSIIALIYGPICGLVIGALSDILGFFINNVGGGGFFFGYTLQAMLTSFIYGLVLYEKRVTFLKILLMRLLIGLLCNVVIGSICWGIVYSYEPNVVFAYAITFSLPKNLVYLIPQSLVLYIIMKGVLPIPAKFELIDKEIAKKVTVL